MNKIPITERREWSFLPYRKHRDEATGLVHDLPPVVVEDGIGVIASCGFGGPDHDNVAFARLMAAAPDLLRALQAEEEWRGREEVGEIDPEWYYEVMVASKRRVAIAKATGA